MILKHMSKLAFYVSQERQGELVKGDIIFNDDGNLYVLGRLVSPIKLTIADHTGVAVEPLHGQIKAVYPQ